MPYRARITLAALATLTGVSAWATVVVALSVEEMTQHAPLVVRAVAGPSQATWAPDHSGIWTTTELKVTEALKGPAATTVLVKQPGGEVGPIGQFAAGAARFAPGEDVVLFLEPSADEKGVYVVQGLSAGKVALEDRRGVPTAVRHLSGLAFASKGAAAIRRVDDVDELGTAQALLARVRAAAKGARR